MGKISAKDTKELLTTIATTQLKYTTTNTEQWTKIPGADPFFYSWAWKQFKSFFILCTSHTGMFLSFFSFHTSNYFLHDPRLWVVDTGASGHMSMPKTPLSNMLLLLTRVKAHLPDSRHNLVYHSGSSYINHKIILHNVFQIPSYKVNLLSVARLTDQIGCHFSFFSDHFSIQDQQGTWIGKGRKIGGL